MALDSLKSESREQIGRGGFGRVYRIHHKHLDLAFALKVLDPWGGDDGGSHRDRFFREARILFDLSHPNIVRVFDVGLLDDEPYILMELVQGRTLQEELTEAGRMRPERAFQIVTEIAEGLRHAHSKVIHRDLKPGNVMIDKDDHVYLLDFGLGVFIEEDLASRITKTGERVVGGNYTAPELQANPRLREPHVDIYSVGAIWFELLTGRVPAGTGIEKALDDEVTLPAEQKTILVRCLAPAAARYASASELLRALKRTGPEVLDPKEAQVDERVGGNAGKGTTERLLTTIEAAEPDLTAAQSFTCQLVKKGHPFWTFGWQAVLQNLSRSDSQYRIECRYLNDEGHVLRTLADYPGIVLRPNETKAFPGSSSVDSDLASAVRSVLALVSRRAVDTVETAMRRPSDAVGQLVRTSSRSQSELILAAWRLLHVALGRAAGLLSQGQYRPDFRSKLRNDEDAERYLRTLELTDEEVFAVLSSGDPSDRSRTFARIEDSKRYGQVEQDLAAFQNYVIENEPLLPDSVYESLIDKGRSIGLAMIGFRLALQEPHAYNLEEERYRANEKISRLQNVGMKELKQGIRSALGIADGEGLGRG